MTKPTSDLRIHAIQPLIQPALLLEELPITDTIADLVNHTRQQITDIIHGKSKRLLAIVGPCSIHDPAAALEYAQKLKKCADRFQDDLCIVMRVYFEKPRTTVGWKGLINDPKLNDSFAINQGLRIARKLLLNINQAGLTAGTEFLDTTIPQFISDLISWGAIGARTTESQTHRELTSGLSMPVGFKNGTGGSVQIAIDAINAARHPHHFLGVTQQGVAAIVSTKGNNNCHIILRGSSHGPNYFAHDISKVENELVAHHLPPYLMVDCSHGNSQKDHRNQHIVATSLADQIKAGSKAICGIMLESNLVAGNQQLENNKKLEYGKSITDACISFEETVPLLEMLANAVKSRN